MSKLVWILITVTVLASACLAQFGGAGLYGQRRQGSDNALANEQAKRVVNKDDMPPAGSMFLDASILINVKADEYVAVFGINQEGATLDECSQKMAVTIGQFLAELARLGLNSKDLFVDFVAENRIYGYELAGDVAKEKLVGFELKKNVSVRFKNPAFLDKLMGAASRVQIFDLIKVDYVVKDIDAVHAKLMEAAAGVLKLKAAGHARLLGISLRPSPQVCAERYAAYYPSEMYDSYAAFEAEDVSGNFYRQKYTVQNARKSRTFYFNALNGKSFDRVINPVVTEPVVQFTLYLKALYDKGPVAKSKPHKPAKQ